MKTPRSNDLSSKNEKKKVYVPNDNYNNSSLVIYLANVLSSMRCKWIRETRMNAVFVVTIAAEFPFLQLGLDRSRPCLLRFYVYVGRRKFYGCYPLASVVPLIVLNLIPLSWRA
ncbi:hypothetical protein BDF21DRAFT_450526 [Thamnidium elegans]|nr:hypothetical protein BDF21DRAFT_450526 [Thamnidium elegans]